MFTHSSYARRSQKCKKLLELTVFFALLGSASVKAVRKHAGEIDPMSRQWTGFQGQFSSNGNRKLSVEVIHQWRHALTEKLCDSLIHIHVKIKKRIKAEILTRTLFLSILMTCPHFCRCKCPIHDTTLIFFNLISVPFVTIVTPRSRLYWRN